MQHVGISRPLGNNLVRTRTTESLLKKNTLKPLQRSPRNAPFRILPGAQQHVWPRGLQQVVGDQRRGTQAAARTLRWSARTTRFPRPSLSFEKRVIWFPPSDVVLFASPSVFAIEFGLVRLLTFSWTTSRRYSMLFDGHPQVYGGCGGEFRFLTFLTDLGGAAVLGNGVWLRVRRSALACLAGS